MNLDDDYQYILALATHGSLSAAAKQLNVTHTTVARRIHAFEARFNVTLFERVPKGYQLTQIGRSVLPDIERLKSLQGHIERQLEGQDKSLKGEVNIALTPELAHDYVIPLLDEFYQCFPHIQLNLIMGTSQKDLNAREADIALRFTPEPTQPDLIGKKLFASNWGVYASDSYIKKPKQIDNLLLWQLEFHKDWYQGHFNKTQIIARFDNLAALISATDQGLGIAKLPCGLADQAKYENLRRLDLTTSPSNWSLWLLYHFDLKETAKIMAVKSFLIEHFSKFESRFLGETSRYL
ncbi:LysR family transcriptional regulator [Pseudoalteromonas phenolica]|uniref:Transcriptional regulatory protein n=1 Tax=Pseudoalteromonas phenolica TaxID=161398 RepID=A0A0S2JYT9_9GAMM|nr:LysR family transcriptional regulator [Pseudoalteromonas phenolica]ALO41338.1 Transcriptional regulatory protein [Pseudoalteromonas phenolica]MBE0354121.1 hypothetical protein [Pseudoalteromonas phenolica O-BC30]RXF05203.1 LysR family transcriptional regulator [Pseudoalteromonas phenolica O-BC30]